MSYARIKKSDGTYIIVDNSVRDSGGTLVAVSDDVIDAGASPVTVFGATVPTVGTNRVVVFQLEDILKRSFNL